MQVAMHESGSVPNRDRISRIRDSVAAWTDQDFPTCGQLVKKGISPRVHKSRWFGTGAQ
jgi:hypothetical protein